MNVDVRFNPEELSGFAWLICNQEQRLMFCLRCQENDPEILSERKESPDWFSWTNDLLMKSKY